MERKTQSKPSTSSATSSRRTSQPTRSEGERRHPSTIGAIAPAVSNPTIPPAILSALVANLTVEQLLRMLPMTPEGRAALSSVTPQPEPAQQPHPPIESQLLQDEQNVDEADEDKLKQPDVQVGGELEVEEGNQSVVPGSVEVEVDGVDVVIGGDDLMDVEKERNAEEQTMEVVGEEVPAQPAEIVVVPDDEADEPEMPEHLAEARLKQDMDFVFGNVQIPMAEFTEAEMDASLNTRKRSRGWVPRFPDSLQHMAETLGQPIQGDRVEGTGKSASYQQSALLEREQRESKRKGRTWPSQLLRRRRGPPPPSQSGSHLLTALRP